MEEQHINPGQNKHQEQQQRYGGSGRRSAERKNIYGQNTNYGQYKNQEQQHQYGGSGGRNAERKHMYEQNPNPGQYKNQEQQHQYGGSGRRSAKRQNMYGQVTNPGQYKNQEQQHQYGGSGGLSAQRQNIDEQNTNPGQYKNQEQRHQYGGLGGLSAESKNMSGMGTHCSNWTKGRKLEGLNVYVERKSSEGKQMKPDTNLSNIGLGDMRQTMFEQNTIHNQYKNQAQKHQYGESGGRSAERQPMYGRGAPNGYRIVLIGKTGAGKSATRNSLLEKYNRKNMKVIETPGLLDLSKKSVKQEIVNCVAKVLPGPHVFVLVVQIDGITEEEQKTVDMFIKYFGKDIYNFMIIVFTGMGELKNNTELEQFVDGIGGSMSKTLRNIGHRYIGFDNKDKRGSLPEQVDRFYEMVREIVSSNDGRYYSNKMLNDADTAFQKEMMAKEKAIAINEKREREKAERFYRLSCNNVQSTETDIDRVKKKNKKDRRGIFGKLKRFFTK